MSPFPTAMDGIGWAILEGHELSGMICIHLGDDSEFVARRPEEMKRNKGK
jgi:hypothetical protein